jgi:hypothetical protein
MNHQAIEFLARDRIDGYAREAASARLARINRTSTNDRRSTLLGVLGGGRILAVLRAAAGTLASSARALVTRPGESR